LVHREEREVRERTIGFWRVKRHSPIDESAFNSDLIGIGLLSNAFKARCFRFAFFASFAVNCIIPVEGEFFFVSKLGHSWFTRVP